MKVMVVIGTRPEAIKMSPVVKAIEEYREWLQPVVCVTGQHREMLDQVLEIFDIKPDYDLNVMKPNQTLSGLTATLITGLDQVMTEAKPDWVLVQGDTTSAMAAGLVAFYHNVKLGHIEAGLRTHDRRQPFPEEVNRRITDLMSDLYFTPTEQTRMNLLREGVNPDHILVTGNTVIDALLMTAQRVHNEPLHEVSAVLDGKRVILVTSHRRENFGEPFLNVCSALRTLADRYQDSTHFVFPVHYNPNVRGPAYEILGGIPNITLTDPVNYRTMVKLIDRSYLVMTDSGGIQEEAPSLHKPILILREVTERQEVVEAGAAKLVGCDADRIVRETIRLIEEPDHYQRMSSVRNPYGDGTSSLQIIRAILHDAGLLTDHGWRLQSGKTLPAPIVPNHSSQGLH
jgi:UDP-N-acetylglucosamine 2-epimerase (non-hydrolysing)